jgi:cytidylate kinase
MASTEHAEPLGRVADSRNGNRNDGRDVAVDEIASVVVVPYRGLKEAAPNQNGSGSRGLDSIDPSELRNAEPGATDDVFRIDQPIVITIDGPAGTGKSYAARHLAARLGLEFLDTGAMYRAAAWLALERKIDWQNDRSRFLDTVVAADIRFDWGTKPPDVLVFDRVITDQIRTPQVTAIVSPLAAVSELRAIMRDKQRAIGAAHPFLVSEGRDQGTEVFTNAKVKFYLDADPGVRAKRRLEEMIGRGERANLNDVLAAIIERDESDRRRTDGPLRVPDGADIIDTDNLSREQVIDKLVERVMHHARTPDAPQIPKL